MLKSHFQYKLFQQDTFEELLDCPSNKFEKFNVNILTDSDRAIHIEILTKVCFNSLTGDKKLSKMGQKFEIPYGVNSFDVTTNIPEIIHRAYSTHAGWISAKYGIILNLIPSLFQITEAYNSASL